MAIIVAGGPRPVMVGMFVLSFFITYLGLGVAGVVIVSLRQASTAQSMMGRMTAVFRTLLFGGGALGGLSTGLLAGRIGARDALTVAAFGSAAVLIALALSPVSRLRGLPSAPEEPVTAAPEEPVTGAAEEPVTAGAEEPVPAAGEGWGAG